MAPPTFPKFLDLPPEVRNQIYSYALSFPRDSCNLAQLCSFRASETVDTTTNSNALTRVSHDLCTETLSLLFWRNDWSVSLTSNNGTSPLFQGFSISTDSHLNIAVSGFDDSTPLFRRLRIWGHGELGGPYLAFCMRNGKAGVDHGSPCPLCAVPAWREEVARPVRAPEVMGEMMGKWEEAKRVHDRGREELAARLFRFTEVRPRGFSVENVRCAAAEIRGGLLADIRRQPREMWALMWGVGGEGALEIAMKGETQWQARASSVSYSIARGRDCGNTV